MSNGNLIKMLGNEKIYSTEEAISVASKKGKSYWREIFAKRKDLSFDFVISKLTELDSTELALAYIWNEGHEPLQVIKFAKAMNDSEDLWEEVFKNHKVLMYLSNMSSNAIITFAEEIDSIWLWAYVLSNKKNCIPSFAILKARELDSVGVWKEVLLRDDITPSDVLHLAMNLPDEIMEKLCATERISKFLTNPYIVGKENVISFGKVINSRHVWALLLSRTDIPVLEARTQAIELNDDLVWGEVIGREDFDPDDAVSIASSFADPMNWKNYFARKTVSALSKISLSTSHPKTPSISSVMSMPDVMNFVESMEPNEVIDLVSESPYANAIYDHIMRIYPRCAPIENAIKLAKEITPHSPYKNANGMWVSIMRRPEITWSEAINLADENVIMEAGGLTLYESIIERGDVPMQDIVCLCKRFPELFDSALLNADFRNYIKSIE